MLDRITRLTLLGLHLFLAITAIFGAVFVVPRLPREWLAGTPFPDYTIPALALGVVIGGGAPVAAAMLIFQEPWGVLLSLAVGGALCMFEVVETTVVGGEVWLHALGLTPTLGNGVSAVDAAGAPAPMGVPLPLWLQPFYFIFGLVVIALARRLWTHHVRLRLHPQPAGA
jgi:hypothetical protein